MVVTGSASAVVQIVATLTGLVLIPILVRHLGAIQYGLYATIASTVAWLALAQIGMGPSVLNELSTLRVRMSAERSLKVVSTATAIQLGIAVVLLIVISIVGAYIPWHRMFNAPNELRFEASIAALIMLLGFISQLPISLGKVAFEAHQRGYVAQGWQLVSYLLRLGFTIIVVVADGSLSIVVLALVLPNVLAQLATYIHAFKFSYPDWMPRRKGLSSAVGRRLLNVGGAFFMLNVASLVIASTDNLVIAHVVGPSAVTPYDVTFRLSQLPTLLTVLLLNAAWPAYREAATADPKWLSRTHRRMSALGLVLPALSAAILLFSGRHIIAIWAGPEAVPSSELLTLLAIIAVTQGLLLPSERLLIGFGEVRICAVLGLVNAAINLPLSIFLAREFGSVGVALATVVGYVVVGTILLTVARRRLRLFEVESGVRV